MKAIDDQQRATADLLVRDLLDTPAAPRAVWNLAGTVGSGKSLVLRMIQQSLTERGFSPLMVNAPAGDVDAASIALAETASQLKTASLVNGEMAAFCNPEVTWIDKMAAIIGAVDRNSEKVVVLCDEPRGWYHHHESFIDDSPAYSARHFVEWIVERAKCRRIIAGWIPNDVPVVSRVFAPRLDDGRKFLGEHRGWGAGTTLANDLKLALPHPLPERCLWEMNLLVAISRFKGHKAVAALANQGSSVVALLDELLDELEREVIHRPICEALARLSLPRTPIDRQTFEALTQSLSLLDRDIIAVCLCETVANRLSLHPLVRNQIVSRMRDPGRWETNTAWRLAPEDRRSSHQRVSMAYEKGPAATLRDEWESFHHDLLGGGTDPVEGDGRIKFVEQLHEIGRTISYVDHDHERAARLFRVAIKLSPKHPYGHHYLAFNLDWLAKQPDEVEEHYQEAIRLQPTHPWWWSRWISYLTTRGQPKHARTQWRKAIDAMSISEDGSPPWIFMSLHRWVARWLLHWGDLDFAEQVLRSIPLNVAQPDAGIQVLNDLLSALRAAERGTAVFPLTVRARDWWSPNPHTDLPLIWKGQTLRTWKPARVESVDQKTGQVFLLAAERPQDSKESPKFVELDLRRKDVEDCAHSFKWNDLREGRFVELAAYGVDGILRIGLHRETTWNDRDLLPLVPPPDRWFQRALAETLTPTETSP